MPGTTCTLVWRVAASKGACMKNCACSCYVNLFWRINFHNPLWSVAIFLHRFVKSKTWFRGRICSLTLISCPNAPDNLNVNIECKLQMDLIPKFDVTSRSILLHANWYCNTGNRVRLMSFMTLIWPISQLIKLSDIEFVFWRVQHSIKGRESYLKSWGKFAQKSKKNPQNPLAYFWSISSIFEEVWQFKTVFPNYWRILPLLVHCFHFWIIFSILKILANLPPIFGKMLPFCDIFFLF